ncbi:Uncharacterised protein [uncultured Prevotella sp.]|uniref:hypothetical protein n=1 Tax=uncultured Prevotella sp. TaxID=159272 RepID=UPI001A62E2EA|nr:hypothetical protein [uncultured Prevotella sp.]VTY11199.1 Uncharacterised protein [uncultured Prevotella sp.]
MVKKKTRVIMPGGISGLVNKVQGIEKSTVTPPAEPEPEEEITPEPEPIREPVHHEPTLHTKPAAPADEKDRSAPAAKKLPKAEGKELAREYTLQQGDTTDSWQMFLDLAKEYKLRDSKLATVYIDSDLKSVLDRLKSANSIKMPSTALLSSIVARFVFDHEKNIKEAIYGDSLL